MLRQGPSILLSIWEVTWNVESCWLLEEGDEPRSQLGGGKGTDVCEGEEGKFMVLESGATFGDSNERAGEGGVHLSGLGKSKYRDG